MSMIILPGGRWHDLANPWAGTLDLPAIAAALGKINRWNGHTSRPYSVAEHSIRVSQLVPKPLRLQALLHDVAEVFVGDMATPLRSLVVGFDDIERDHLRWIGTCLGVELCDLSAEVRHADRVMLATECRDLLGSPYDWCGVDPLEAVIGPASPCDVGQLWLKYVQERVG
jgi:hypothetical protein